ncbi:MAG: serine hydrolase domain-containing protein [Leptospirales bacterium]
MDRNDFLSPKSEAGLSIRDMMNEGVRNGVYPGGILLVAGPGEILKEISVGKTRIDLPDAPPVTPDTLFDLASLTKPLVTAALSLIFVAERKLDLETPIKELLPASRSTFLGNLPYHRLLSHSSGLTSWAPLYRDLTDATNSKEGLLSAILNLPPAYSPGTRSEYSDFGYILAGWILESVGGDRLDRLFHNKILEPLGILDAGYTPTAQESPLSERVFAATEPPEEGAPFLCGVVHDEHARFLGGIAGHAGLFGTARAVWQLSRPWMGEGTLFPARFLEQFQTRQEGTPCTLGWDTPTEQSSSGHLFSSFSIGHLGYTGTSIWIDLQRQIIIILLTHRVHPTRTTNLIRPFRPRLHDLIMQEVLGTSP